MVFCLQSNQFHKSTVNEIEEMFDAIMKDCRCIIFPPCILRVSTLKMYALLFLVMIGKTTEISYQKQTKNQKTTNPLKQKEVFPIPSGLRSRLKGSLQACGALWLFPLCYSSKRRSYPVPTPWALNIDPQKKDYNITYPIPFKYIFNLLILKKAMSINCLSTKMDYSQKCPYN